MGAIDSVMEDTQVSKEHALLAIERAFSSGEFIGDREGWTKSIPLPVIIESGTSFPAEGTFYKMEINSARTQVDTAQEDPPSQTTGNQSRVGNDNLRNQPKFETYPPKQARLVGHSNQTTMNQSNARIHWARAEIWLSRSRSIEILKEKFKTLDKDNNKVLTRDEFSTALMEEGHSREEALDLFSAIDTMRTGKITITKFIEYQDVHLIALVKIAFSEADRQHDRQLSKSEFWTYFRKEGLTAEHLNDLWFKIDSNHNCFINFIEFKTWAQERARGQAIETWDVLVEPPKDSQTRTSKKNRNRGTSAPKFQL